MTEIVTPIPPTGRSSWIIYIHPDVENPAYEQLVNLWTKMEELYTEGVIDWNVSLGYPFHASVTSFFRADNETLSRLIKRFPEFFPEKDISCSNFTLKIGNKMINIDMKSNLGKNADKLKKEFPMIKIINKNKLHITLAHNFKKKDRDIIEQTIDENIDLSKWKKKPFKAVLWERTANKQWIRMT